MRGRSSRAVLAALAVALVVASRAGAVPVLLSGFDTANTSSPPDSYELTKVTSGGGTLSLVQQAATPNHAHGATNGADGVSKWALKTVVSSTQTAYATLATSLADLPQATIGVNVHIDSAPGGARSILAATEVSGAVGCFAVLNTNRTVSVYYRSASNPIGTSGRTLEPNHCSTDPSVPCSANGDCASNSCTACSSNYATGTGCAWIGLELVQTTATPTVECDLRINGRLDVDGAPFLPSGGAPGFVRNLRVGASDALAGESGALTAWFDDLVVDNGDRAGVGYVTRAVPLTQAGAAYSATQFDDNGACTPTTHPACVNDFGVSPYQYDSDTSDTLKKGQANRVEAFTKLTPTLTVPSDGSKVTAVEALLVGRGTATGGTRELQPAVLYCAPAGSCPTGLGCGSLCEQQGPAFSIPSDATDRLLTRFLVSRVGDKDGTTWTAATLPNAALKWTATKNHSTLTHVGAALLYARVQRPDVTPPRLLTDRNIGTNDGRVTVASVGDSTNGGTLSVVCVEGEKAGQACTFDDYCSWDTETRDHPVGGCNGIDAVCQTCTLRRPDFNGGAGYPCTANGDCSLSTCSGSTSGDCTDAKDGTCSGDAGVACSCTSDCDLGTCDTTATCAVSCPGGTCPNARTAWGDLLGEAVGADTVLKCPQGTETTVQLLANRWANIVNGRDPTCELVKGNAGHCTCPSGLGQCGGTGSCTAGVCSGASCASDADCQLCTSSGDCAAGSCVGGLCPSSASTCQFDPPDAIVVLEAYNDVSILPSAPQCTGLYATQQTSGPFQACDDPTGLKLCQRDADCDTAYTGTTDSECFGMLRTSTDDLACYTNFAGFPCTLYTQPCRTSSDCSADAATGGDVCSVNQPTAPRKEGVCKCDSDADCPTGFLCHGDSNCTTGTCFCRLACSADSGCPGTASGRCATGSGGATNTNTTPNDGKTCKGGCTYPSDARTCTTDAQCTSSTVWFPSGVVYPIQGTCTDGRCSCTGPNACPTASVCPENARLTERTEQPRFTLDRFTAMQAAVDAMADTDGRPLVVFSTLPDLNQNECDVPRERGDNYLRRVSEQLRSEFPNVADPRPTVAKLPRGTIHADDVHFNSAGARVVGLAIADYLNTRGACAIGQCLLAGETAGGPCAGDGDCSGGRTCAFGAFARAQKYCRSSAGTYTSTACAKDADCPSTAVCVPRACSTGSDCPSAGDACNPG